MARATSKADLSDEARGRDGIATVCSCLSSVGFGFMAHPRVYSSHVVGVLVELYNREID